MTRIIGGRAGGRRLRTPPGSRTRPTSDRVREALFSSVESALGSLQGLRVLDLYAGSGAVGLEAWSRGASEVTLVEQDRRTAGVVTANAKVLGCTGVDVVCGAVARHLADTPRAPYELVFLDPPYSLATEAVVADLAALARGWLAEDALVVVERAARDRGLTWPPGFDPGRVRRYGETSLSSATWRGDGFGTVATPPPYSSEEP
ncbi:MAG TPA: 16S rRNA (guanine(966)-N(2))-methyltransferase RsmD [Marmoricola sp.]|nr:16S rRNA (guanine(966)-N(2))-methyltransferase RsmD [Marmoricola sp.]